jgi:hypothetical protein
VSAATADGLLTREFDTVWVATDETSASLSWLQPLLSHRGTLALTGAASSEPITHDFRVSLGFTERGMTGLMRGIYRPRDETELLASHVDFMCFPQGLPPQEHGFSFPGCED